jgi:hypothetical protein
VKYIQVTLALMQMNKKNNNLYCVKEKSTIECCTRPSRLRHAHDTKGTTVVLELFNGRYRVLLVPVCVMSTA